MWKIMHLVFVLRSDLNRGLTAKAGSRESHVVVVKVVVCGMKLKSGLYKGFVSCGFINCGRSIH